MRLRTSTILLSVLGLVFYLGMVGSLAGAPRSDAAGRGLALSFGAIFGMSLWLVLLALMLISWREERRPAWQGAVSMLLLPLSGIAASLAVDLYFARETWALWLCAALPPLLALYALLPAATLPATATIVLLSLAAIGVATYRALPDPARDAMIKAQQEQEAKQAREAVEREAAQFEALGPDSTLGDYLHYLHDGTYGERALAGIQRVKSRQSDAVALLQKGPLMDLADLWQFNVIPTRELCTAYGEALAAAASQITKARSDYINAAIDIEWQLPNLKWLGAAKCDLTKPLERAEANIRSVADSARLTNLADNLADIRSKGSQ